MEISDYLVIIRRRLWILVLVPLVVGAAVYWRIQTRPTRYVATATVAATSLVGGSNSQYGGSFGIRAFVANFVAATTSAPIADKVAKETGVPSDEIASGIHAESIGESAVIDVRFETYHRDKAGAVARSVATETIRALFAPQVAQTQRAADEAKKQVDAADAAIAKFTADTGLLLPDPEFRLKQQQLSQLQQQQLAAEARDDVDAAVRYEAAAIEVEAQLRDLAPKVQAYQGLADQRSQAVSRYNSLRSQYESAKGQYDAANPESLISVSSTAATSRVPDLIRYVGAGVGAALFLAVFVVVLLEAATRRRPVAATRARVVPGSAESETLKGGPVPSTNGKRLDAVPDSRESVG
jgi:uncharacterized protein involved in exopolysaccharide biosynthesis